MLNEYLATKLIDKWDESNSKLPLSDYMKLSLIEYAEFVYTNKLPKFYMFRFLKFWDK